MNDDVVPFRSHESEPDNDYRIRDSVEEVIEHLQSLLAGERVHGLSTGFEELDDLTSGLKPGEVFVIASQPGMGKTSLMLRMVEHICIDHKVPTLIFSGHTTAFETTQRLMYSRAKFSLNECHRGYTPTKDDLQRIQQAALEFADAELFVDDRTGLEINFLRERARRYGSEKKIGFIAVDDVRLVMSNSARAERYSSQERTEVSAGIKALARELGIPILVLADLNHPPYFKVKGKVRRISHIADFLNSGAICQNADIVGWLDRTPCDVENVKQMETNVKRADLIVVKNRHGKSGWIQLLFIENLMRFETCPDELRSSGSCDEDEIHEAWKYHYHGDG